MSVRLFVGLSNFFQSAKAFHSVQSIILKFGTLVLHIDAFAFMDFFYEKRPKVGFLGDVRQFSQKVFNLGPQNLFYRYIVGSFICVWKMAPVGHIFGPLLTLNLAEMGQYVGLRLFSGKILRCVKDRLREPNFFRSFWAPNRSKFRLPTILSKSFIRFTPTKLYMLTGATLRGV